MLHPRSAILAATLLLATAAPALAHAYPKTMEPAPGSTVDTAPKQVVIDFTEGIIPTFSSLEVVDSAGKQVSRGEAHVVSHDNREYAVALPELAPGTYKVIWRVTAVDTHKTHGSYDFTIAR